MLETLLIIPDVYESVISYLYTVDILDLMEINKQMYRINRDNKVWREKILKLMDKYRGLRVINLQIPMDYYKTYINIYRNNSKIWLIGNKFFLAIPNLT